MVRQCEWTTTDESVSVHCHCHRHACLCHYCRWSHVNFSSVEIASHFGTNWSATLGMNLELLYGMLLKQKATSPVNRRRISFARRYFQSFHNVICINVDGRFQSMQPFQKLTNDVFECKLNLWIVYKRGMVKQQNNWNRCAVGNERHFNFVYVMISIHSYGARVPIVSHLFAHSNLIWGFSQVSGEIKISIWVSRTIGKQYERAFMQIEKKKSDASKTNSSAALTSPASRRLFGNYNWKKWIIISTAILHE